MREKEATAVLKAIVSPAGRAELSNYRNNLVLPLDYVRAIKIDSPIKDAVTEFQAGNYSNLFKYEEKVRQDMVKEKAALDLFASRVPAITNDQIINYLRTMDKSATANKSANRDYYLDRIKKIIADPSHAAFRQMAASYARTFGHDMGEDLHRNWRTEIQGAQTKTAEGKPITNGSGALLPLLAIGTLFLLG